MWKNEYGVTFVGPGELPSGHAWVLIEIGPRIHIVFDQEHLSPRVLLEAWEAYRLVANKVTKRLPKFERLPQRVERDAHPLKVG